MEVAFRITNLGCQACSRTTWQDGLAVPRLAARFPGFVPPNSTKLLLVHGLCCGWPMWRPGKHLTVASRDHVSSEKAVWFRDGVNHALRSTANKHLSLRPPRDDGTSPYLASTVLSSLGSMRSKQADYSLKQIINSQPRLTM
ncbi:hypothetical protein CGRA01v4_14569 [Colletotrichum graminicola]|nr:hypothetical protein CGRA01v4_14569 [Colletotrichum graminicola]